ncbi:DsbA family oxidoreductase [Elioraea sp.]|uniref:DsbA family oxidoreductase n=1 Tax=Elioraea sp. TaxID=2185103 RepID=UPI003F707383
MVRPGAVGYRHTMNMLARPPERLAVEVVFDLVCPWCWIGLRRLTRTLALRPDLAADLTFQPFLLNPDMPARGIAHADYIQRKFGGEDRARRLHAAIAEVGRAEGLAFRFERILRTPATVDAHRLVRFAARDGRAAETVEALFTAHFAEARDIGDRVTLVQVAIETGLDAHGAAGFLASGEDTETVLVENLRSHRLGINGVPCFVVAGKHAIAGAQEPEVLERLLDVAMMEQAGAM